MNVKQVVLIRKDLKMRRGKEIAQGSHASMAWLQQRIKKQDAYTLHDGGSLVAGLPLSQDEFLWLMRDHTKVCLQVDSKEELLKYLDEACKVYLEAHLIVDAGRTEFNGVATVTACAIGPGSAEEIDKITGHLKLY